MGKTSLNKMELVARQLGICVDDKSALVDLLVTAITNAECRRVQVNVISNDLIMRVINTLTGILITPNNLSYYKNTQYGDFVTKVAKSLRVPVHKSVNCQVSMHDQKLLLEPMQKGSIAALHALVNKSQDCNMVGSYYRIWASSGWKVGDKRNWIQPSLLRWLQEHNVLPAIPISHSLPSRLRDVYRYLTIIAHQADTGSVAKGSLNSWIDEKLLSLCNDELIKKAKSIISWLPKYPYLPDVKFVVEMPAANRLTPYLYCRAIDDLHSKVGKANNSTRFRESDKGVVICLKREYSNDVLADCETLIINELLSLGVPLVSGKNEHFEAPYSDLCKIILSICNSSHFLRTKIISISAVNK